MYDHVNLCIFVIHRLAFWFVFLLLLQFYLDFLFCGSQSFSSFKYAIYCSLFLYLSQSESVIAFNPFFWLHFSQSLSTCWFFGEGGVWITFFFFSSSPPPSSTLSVHSTFYTEYAFRCTVPFFLRTLTIFFSPSVISLSAITHRCSVLMSSWSVYSCYDNHTFVHLSTSFRFLEHFPLPFHYGMAELKSLPATIWLCTTDFYLVVSLLLTVILVRLVT